MAIRQQKSYKILVIGDACLDEYHFGSCERLSPEAPVPIFKRIRHESKQGMCLNVASNLKSLGHSVHVDKNIEKIKKIRLIDKKSNHHILRIDDEPDIKSVDIRKYTRKSMIGFDALVISDYDKGYIRHGDILDIIEPARFIGIPIFVDSKKRDLSKFEECIIKINEKENELVTELPQNSEVIVTYGKNGAIWNSKIFPANQSEMHDVCGAGDVFLAGLVHKYLETSGDLEKSIVFANKCASISVSHFGTYTIKKEDLS